MLEGQSAAWAHLRFITFGQGDVEPRGDESALQGAQRDGRVEKGTYVYPGRERCGVFGQRVT